MDSNFVIKTRAGAYIPRDPVRVREAVATDLDMDKAVAAASDGDDKPGGQRHDHPTHDHAPLEHPAHDPEVVVDPASRDVIYRERDVRTAEREHPDQALLRQRAYRLPPAEPVKVALDTEPHADVKA